jgi:hypothetical protein
VQLERGNESAKMLCECCKNEYEAKDLRNGVCFTEFDTDHKYWIIKEEPIRLYEFRIDRCEEVFCCFLNGGWNE